jgi:iron complex outermembrane receptor protein
MTNLYVILLSIIVVHASAQQGTVKGTVKSNDNQPAPYVNVVLKGKSIGTISGSDGSYVIRNVKPGNYTLVTSFVGLQSQEKQISVAADVVTEVEFILFESAQQLSEVVIMGTRGLNENTVNAGKIDINPMDLPQSVMVIDRQILERQQTLRISDVLMNTNGVYLMGATGGTQEEIAGRGFAFGSNNTFKNGSRFNNGVMPELSSLERVEIMKGSNAILFGNVAAGGIINLVTKKPKFENGGEVSLRVGSYDFYKPSLDVYGKVNNSDRIAYRLNTSYENARSFRDNVKSDRIYFNPSFLIKAGEKTEILVEGDYLKDNRTLDYGTGAINYEIANVPRNRFLGASWSYYAAEQKSTTVTITHQLTNRWKLRGTAGYQGFISDAYGTSRPNSGSFVREDGKWVRGLQRSGSDQDYFIGQIDATGKFNTGSIEHNLLVGADIDKYNTKTLSYTYKNPLANPKFNNGNVYDSINILDLNEYQQRNDIPEIGLNAITKNPINRTGFYVQDLVSLTEKIKVLAGIRYTYVDSKSSNTYDHAFTPRFGLVYQPLKSTSVFASYANSFDINTGTDNNGGALAPSYINQLEVGIKNELLKGFLSTNITLYQIVNSNLAQTILQSSPDFNPSYPNARELAGEVTSKGVEIDIMSKAYHGATLLGGYSYNDTRYTESNIYAVNSRLRYNPMHTANLSLYYAFQHKSLQGFNVGFTTQYIGERVAGRSTRLTVANDTYKLMTVPNYFQFDASAGYSKNNISVRIKVSNLLNEFSYNIHDDNSVNPIAPRQFSATVAYKW